MPFIPEDKLEDLTRYRYGGIDKSYVSRHILGPYWTNLVKIFPLWMAPNMITLIGLCTVIVNVLTLFYYAPDLGECPRWVYSSFGIGLFIYQSLDAIDGKQARRTGQSGPLGELFDHGCDALNTTLGVITWASSTYLGQSWWTVVSLCASLGNFYLSTWEEYHTGVLYLGHFSGPVEGVLMLCGIHLMSGYFGPAFWMLRIQEVLPMIDFGANNEIQILGSLQLNHILIVIGALVTFFNMISALRNVIKVKLYPTDMSNPDRSILKATLGLTPFISSCTITYQWLKLWPDIVSDHLSYFMLFVGFLFGHQVGRMITCHVTKMRFPYTNIPVNIILTSGYLLAKFEPQISNSGTLDHGIIIKLYLIVAAGLYSQFAQGVINQICNYLDIGCLRIKKKDDKKTS